MSIWRQLREVMAEVPDYIAGKLDGLAAAINKFNATYQKKRCPRCGSTDRLEFANDRGCWAGLHDGDPHGGFHPWHAQTQGPTEEETA